jgi:hypothetical protein
MLLEKIKRLQLRKNFPISQSVNFPILLIASILSVLILGCGGIGLDTGEYSFSDTATFYAPKSKIKLTVFSTGHVIKDADLGRGKGSAELVFAEKYTDTLKLITSPENIDTIIYKGRILPFHCDQVNKIKLYNFLDSAGFKYLDRNEISELRDAMTFINYGHKAGFYYGQTKYIQINELKRHTSFD